MIKPREELNSIKIYDIPLYPDALDMKLDSNENYIGPSTAVMRALKEITPEDISHYPCYGKLYEILAEINKLDLNQLVITNGADEALSAVLNTYISKNDIVLNVSPSFVMPKIYSNIIGANYIEIPYEIRWEYPYKSVIAAIEQYRPKLLIITTPNNPTGDIVNRAYIEELLNKYPDMLFLVDETYANFAGISNIDLINNYDNIIIVKSLSKDNALAGLRLGYVASDSKNISFIKRVLSPYNVNVAAVTAAVACLSDSRYFEYVSKEIQKSKEYIISELEKLSAIVYKSYANFILVDFGSRSELVYNMLKANKIAVKSFSQPAELKNCLRITLPTYTAAQRLIAKIKTKITIVFDMDGVLVDVSKSYHESIKYTYNYFTGKHITDEQIFDAKKRGGLNNDWDLTSYLIKQSGFDFDYNKIVDVFQSQYWNDGRGSINKEILLIDTDMLEKLSKKYNLAVFTGRPRQEAIFTLSKFNIKQYFSKIVTMDDLPFDKQKPNNDGLLLIKDSFVTDFLIYFGDTVDDAKCASSFAGAYGVGVLPPNNKSPELKDLLLKSGAKSVINNINELNTVLESIDNENKQNCT